MLSINKRWLKDTPFGSLHTLLCFSKKKKKENEIDKLGDSVLNLIPVVFIFLSYMLLIMLFSFILLSVSGVLT